MGFLKLLSSFPPVLPALEILMVASKKCDKSVCMKKIYKDVSRVKISNILSPKLNMKLFCVEILM